MLIPVAAVSSKPWWLSCGDWSQVSLETPFRIGALESPYFNSRAICQEKRYELYLTLQNISYCMTNACHNETVESQRFGNDVAVNTLFCLRKIVAGRSTQRHGRCLARSQVPRCFVFVRVVLFRCVVRGLLGRSFLGLRPG